MTILNHMQTISGGSIYSSRLALSGTHAPIPAISIVDLAEKRQVDYFACYHPYFSKTGRYVVFHKFQPRSGAGFVYSDIVVLYDLAKGPEENRIAGASALSAPMRFITGRADIGIPVYPTWNFKNRSYKNTNQTYSDRHVRVSPYAWSDGDRQLAFVTFHDNALSLVVADMGSDNSDIRVGMQPIDGTRVIRRDLSLSEGEIEREGSRLRIKGIKFEGNVKILLRLEPRSRYSETQLSVEIPELRIREQW